MSFQFHKGTIKAPSYDELLTSFFNFQFHKGTIKAYVAFCELVRSTLSIP